MTFLNFNIYIVVVRIVRCISTISVHKVTLETPHHYWQIIRIPLLQTGIWILRMSCWSCSMSLLTFTSCGTSPYCCWVGTCSESKKFACEHWCRWTCSGVTFVLQMRVDFSLKKNQNAGSSGLTTGNAFYFWQGTGKARYTVWVVTIHGVVYRVEISGAASGWRLSSNQQMDLSPDIQRLLHVTTSSTSQRNHVTAFATTSHILCLGGQSGSIICAPFGTASHSSGAGRILAIQWRQTPAELNRLGLETVCTHSLWFSSGWCSQWTEYASCLLSNLIDRADIVDCKRWRLCDSDLQWEIAWSCHS